VLRQEQQKAELASRLQSLIIVCDQEILSRPDMARSEFHFQEGGRTHALAYHECRRLFADLFGEEVALQLVHDYLPHYSGLKETAEKLYRYIRSDKRHRKLKRRTTQRGLAVEDNPAMLDLDTWVGADEATLAIVFSDLVSSASLSAKLGDVAMVELRESHYRRCRDLVIEAGGCEVKSMGDGFLLVFRTAGQALSVGLELASDAGHERLEARVGLHVGPVSIRSGDVFGQAVDFASRICDLANGGELWLSERAREDVLATRPELGLRLGWRLHSDMAVKGFAERYRLWSLAARAAAGSST
jgi:class 3 adenylate cyclase